MKSNYTAYKVIQIFIRIELRCHELYYTILKSNIVEASLKATFDKLSFSYVHVINRSQLIHNLKSDPTNK